MTSAERKEHTVDNMLAEGFYDDPSQLSQLLRERAGSSQPFFRFTDSTHTRSTNEGQSIHDRQPHHHNTAVQRAPASASAPAPAPAVFPRLRDVPPRRVRIDTSHVKPKLPKHDTAPTSTGFVTEREGAGKMYQTFDGVMDAPGDTQPDSQMFKQYTSGLLGSKSNSNSNMVPSPPQLLLGDDGVSAHAPSDEIEFVGSSQSRFSPTVTSPTVINDDPAAMQYHIHDPLTSPLKFQTPAVTARKWDSQGQTVSSVVKTNTTPGTVLSASAFFAFGNGASANPLSLTQAFNATQAATSPVVDAPSEDPVFQRPSPNFVRRSSPPLAVSSPINDRRKEPAVSPALRSSSEPRADYETMKDSQQRRSRGPPKQEASAETQDSFDFPTTVQLRFEKQREKERLGQEAAKSLAAVSAPSPAKRPARKRGTLSASATSNSSEQRRSSKRATYAGPRALEAEESPDELSLLMPVKGNREDDDSPDELSQDVPSTRTPRKRVAPVNEAVEKVLVPNTSSHPLRTLSGRSTRNLSQPGTTLSQPQHESHFKVTTSQNLHRNVFQLRSSKDHEIIMDSQPDPKADVPALPHPKGRPRFTSSPSINQYSINQTTMQGNTGFTSQLVSSSEPPKPPSSSERVATREEELAENQRVPSSPPVLSQEGNLTYEEHAYDEQSEDGDESEAANSNPEQMDMEDDDGLPVASAGKSKQELLFIEDHVDMHDDDEVPATMEHEETHELHDEVEELVRSTHPEHDQGEDSETFIAPPRTERQSTIPETDMLDETQPPLFPGRQSAPQRESRVEESTVDDTNSTSLFHTGKERQTATASPVGKTSVSSAREGATLQSPAGLKVRSLVDIANLPDTQRSTDLHDIEMPQLSFAAEADDVADAFTAASSPARPNKKRKITYSTKNMKTYRGPVEVTDLGSEQAPSSPVDHNLEETLGWTPPLAPTQERENQGALAVTRAREKERYVQPAATLKSKGLRKSINPQTPRKGALKPVNRGLFKKTPEKTFNKVSTESALRQSTTPSHPTRSVEAADDEDEIGMRDTSSPEIYQKPPAFVTAANGSEAPTEELLFPHRVLAFWPGRNFYPATCLGQSGAQGLRVRYDDGNETVLEATQVRAFDLRRGDHVKVDEPGLKKTAYVVVGFEDKLDTDAAGEFPMTDRHGYATIVLEEKQRDSRSAAKSKQPLKHLNAPMSSIYFTTTLWVRLRDRVYRHFPSSTLDAPASRIGTPAAPDSSALPTPTTTVGRRSTMGMSHLRDVIARGASVASSTLSSGIAFSNMAFAISISKESSEKDAMVKLITSNGGLILDSGFSELFDVNAFEAPTSSEGTAKVDDGLDGLLLKREYKNLGFVAMISDAHSRRTKHVQALALNIPCLHIRWIHDSLSASRALPFAKYLLPAGKSTFLDPSGVVRSRNMNVFDPVSENVTFVQMLKERTLLLTQQTVLLITGRSKKEIERKQPYIFLTHAMGPSDVATCKDVAAAKMMVDAGEWDWVYADGGAEGLAEAATTLFGPAEELAGKRNGAGRKRKRDGMVEEKKTLATSGVIGGRKVRVVGDEFVIQSLILGALIEE